MSSCPRGSGAFGQHRSGRRALVASGHGTRRVAERQPGRPNGIAARRVSLPDEESPRFIGEPTGGGVNFWDDVTFVRLDALPVPMQVGVSTRYWEFADPDDPRLAIEPDVSIPASAENYFAGIGPALEAAIRD